MKRKKVRGHGKKTIPEAPEEAGTIQTDLLHVDNTPALGKTTVHI